MTPKVVTTEGAIMLIRGGIIPESMCAGVDVHGFAYYAGPGRAVILRPGGVRPDGVSVYRGYEPPADESVTGLVAASKPRSKRSKAV